MLCSIFWERSKFYSLLRAFKLRSSSYWKQSTGSGNQWTGFYMVETSAMNELKKHSIYQVSSVYTANFKTLCANKVQPLENISEGTKAKNWIFWTNFAMPPLFQNFFFEAPVLEFVLLPYYRRIYQYFWILVYPCVLLILFNPFLTIKKYCPLKYVYLPKDTQLFLSKVVEFWMVTIFSLNFRYFLIICFVARD